MTVRERITWRRTLIKLKILGLGLVVALAMIATSALTLNTTGQTPEANANGCGYGGYVAYQTAKQFQVATYNQYNNWVGVNGQWVMPRWYYNYSGQLTNGQWVQNVNLYGFEVWNNVSYCVSPGPYQIPQYNVNYWPQYYNAAAYQNYLVQFQYYGWYQTYQNQLRQQGGFQNVSYGFLPNGCYAGPSNLPRFNNGC